MSTQGAHFNAAAWLLDRHVDEGRGDRVAIRCQGRSTTYAEVLDRARAVQALLADHGIEAGDRVAMVVRDDETFPAFFLGALRSGVVPVPLSTMLTGAELAPIVADADARLLVVSEVFNGAVDEVKAGAPALEAVLVADDAPTTPAGAPPAVADTTGDSPGFWLYSSGTTGVPKGVMHTHGNLPATVETYAAQVLEVGPDDRFLSVAKLFFAYGLGNSLTFPFAVGGTAV
ncbi:MAG: AMP-binding protein, partial [Acidimicrobiales bacterium]